MGCGGLAPDSSCYRHGQSVRQRLSPATHKRLQHGSIDEPESELLGQCETLKVERVHRTRYETRAQAKLDIVDWIEGFYNRKRMHTSIGYNTPVAVECLSMTA